MRLREIVVDDVWWVVFPAGRAAGGAGQPEPGWLWARSLSDRRRVARLPCDWERWPDDRLASAIRAAEPLPPMPVM